jgi:pyruvate/2-oxoglutarate dehydrogenase complex dihydrolipoamide dehydrogenase (E3) component
MGKSSFAFIMSFGPNAYVTRIFTAQLRFKAAIVETNDLAGICLSWTSSSNRFCRAFPAWTI